MELRGHVHKGVIVPENPEALSEGAVVRIVILATKPTPPASTGERVSLPLVPSKHPGALRLTAEDVEREL